MVVYSPYDGPQIASITPAETGGTNFRLSSRLSKTGRVILNAGIAKESYFRSHGRNESLWDALQFDIPGNAPLARSAENLWSGSYSTKGMFTSATYLENDDYENQLSTSISRPLPDRYGFSFHYNPTTIEMRYQGPPLFDVTQITSGSDPFNFLMAPATGATINFNLVLNRMGDMKYLENGRMKPGIGPRHWAGKFPSAPEALDIYNKGTMYDIEFFLRTVVQVAIPAKLSQRNAAWDNKTADLGFMTGIPVELHLGKSLRYLVRIDGFQLEHVIFNERMVPLFTNVSVQASRIPDFGDSSRGSGLSNYEFTPDQRRLLNEVPYLETITTYVDGNPVTRTRPVRD